MWCRGGLEGRLLGLALQAEQPQLEAQRMALLQQEEEQRLQLAALDTHLLQSLATCKVCSSAAFLHALGCESNMLVVRPYSACVLVICRLLAQSVSLGFITYQPAAHLSLQQEVTGLQQPASPRPWLLSLLMKEIVKAYSRQRECLEGSQFWDRVVRKVLCAHCVQGSLLDNQELLESLNHAKAKAANITASLQESQLIQVQPLTPHYGGTH